MSKPKELTCKRCGDKFKPTKEEIELHDNGHTGWPELCDDCYQNFNDAMDDISPLDADNGL